MQIIESTAFGVRSAITRLEADDAAPRFQLFPMVHMADPAFYEEIARRLDDCDLVLCEGIRSPIVSLLTSSYRFFEKNPRIGLVCQGKMKLDHLEGRLVHADVSGESFDRRWSELAIWARLTVLLAAPLYGLYLRYFGTRAKVARSLNLNLRQSRMEILSVHEDYTKAKDVILDWRDRHLLDVIEEYRSSNQTRDISIGVFFGAGHVKAVVHHLVGKHGYRIAQAEWVTVFTL